MAHISNATGALAYRYYVDNQKRSGRNAEVLLFGENLGTDGTFPSPNFLVIVSGRASAAKAETWCSATGRAEQLAENSICRENATLGAKARTQSKWLTWP